MNTVAEVDVVVSPDFVYLAKRWPSYNELAKQQQLVIRLKNDTFPMISCLIIFSHVMGVYSLSV